MATAILVDVVVRDKSGRPSTDLSASDFEVFEDGASQRIDSFTRVSHGGGIGVGIAWRNPSTGMAVAHPTHPPRPIAPPDPEEATAALVFDHLSSDSLRLVQRATLDYVPLSGDSGVRVGVFATGPGVRVVQGYTTDRAKLRGAIARTVPTGTAAEDANG